jgi:hypothetical protein
MTNDILILAAGLGDVANAGLSDVSYSGYDILAGNNKFEPTKEKFEALPIFTPIKYLLKVVSLFMILLFGYKLIAGLTKGSAKLVDALRGSAMYLVAAVLLWDITIFLNLIGLVTSFASYISSTISTLVGGTPTDTTPPLPK